MRLLGLSLIFFWSGAALAQTPTPKKRARAPKVLKIKAMHVPGAPQRPEAFYILQRTDLQFKSLAPKKSFIPLILESADKAPF